MKLVLFFVVSLLSIAGTALTIDLESVPKEPKQKINMKVPAVLDTRSALDFGFSRVDESSPLRWQDYAQMEEPTRSLLDSDFSLLARKLRVLGVMPGRPVVVLGLGNKGQGEEGRVAWMLSFLGITDVSMVPYDRFKAKRTERPWEGAVAAPVWVPKVVPFLRIMRPELAEIVKTKKPSVSLIDVRTPEEFRGKVTIVRKKGHIPGSINIPWEKFMNEQGEMLNSEKVRDVLTSAGIPLGNDLVFICSQGLRSGFAAIAAHKSGLKARNYDGALWEWAYDDSLPLVEGK